MKKMVLGLLIIAGIAAYGDTNATLIKMEAGKTAKASDVNENFKTLADKIDALEAKNAEIDALKAQIAGLSMPIGTIVATTLTLEQMTAKYPNGEWVLADGRVSTTEYKNAIGLNNIPDLRGLTLRGKNNGRNDGNQNPDGDLTIGTYQTDAFQGHKHDYQGGFMLTGVNNGMGGVSNTGNVWYPLGNSTASFMQPIVDGINGTPRIALETRMKNVTVNFFIKVK